jgi:hypothetical protein
MSSIGNGSIGIDILGHRNIKVIFRISYEAFIELLNLLRSDLAVNSTKSGVVASEASSNQVVGISKKM